MGKITKWNDKKIAKLNPKAKLPATAITPIYRSDGSGDTYAFTNYLAKVSPAWRSQYGFGTSVGFRAGIGAKGNTGITSSLKTPGAIGYVAAAYLISGGIDAVAIENKAGKFALPNLSNIEEAGAVVKSVRPNVPGGSRERHDGRTDPSRMRDPVRRTPDRGRPFVRPTRGGRPLVRLPDLRTTTVLGPDERTTAPLVSGSGGVTFQASSSRTLDVFPTQCLTSRAPHGGHSLPGPP